MASKSGTKERHRAQEAIARAKGQYDPVKSALAMSGLSQTGMAASGTAQDLLGALQGILSPGTALPFGLSAPNVLEGLITRSREASSRESTRAAQEMANLMPTRGGAAVRGVSDVFQRAGSEQTALETNLRAQAAQQDLVNRLGILGGVTGALPSLTGAASAPVGFQFDIANALAGLDQTLAGWNMQRSMQQDQNRMGMLQGLGQSVFGLGSTVLGAGLMPGGFLSKFLGGANIPGGAVQKGSNFFFPGSAGSIPQYS